ncbi:MAG TPA: hypothetical protein VHW01_04610, partial [Polyangiaceae bacterium]|nr:hypothetical protein [Polyangiaceae bacterium]
MTREAVAVFLGVYAVFALALAGFVRYGTNWPHPDKQLALVVLGVLSVYVAAMSASSVAAAALYAKGGFFAPTLSQAARAILPLIVVAALPASRSTLVVVALSVGLGELARAVGLRLRLRSLGDGALRSSTRGTSSSTRHVWLTAAPSALSLLIVIANPLVDRVVAAPLNAGSVTILDLGEKIFYVPMMVVTSSLTLVAGARWARAANRFPEQLAADLRRSYRIVAAVSIALALASCVGLLLLRLLAGPRFAGASTTSVALVTGILLLGLPGGTTASLGARFLTSTAQTRALPLFGAWSFAGNLAGDVIGAHWFGINGIAAATVLIRSVSAVAYYAYCLRVADALTASHERASSPNACTGARRLPARVRLVRARLAGTAWPAAVIAISLVAGTVAARDARIAAAACVSGLILALGMRLPLRLVPAAALAVLVFVPTAYLPLPIWAGRFASPAVVLFAVWVVRQAVHNRLTGWRTSGQTLTLTALFAGWLLFAVAHSHHLMRSTLWGLVALLVVAGSALVAPLGDDSLHDTL